MLDWFAGAVESAKTMKEIGQSLLTIRDEGIIRERVYELNNSLMDLQQKLLEAQLNQMELVQRIRVLEEEKQQAAQSTNLKDQYAIHTFPTSHHAYVLKSEEAGRVSTTFAAAAWKLRIWLLRFMAPSCCPALGANTRSDLNLRNLFKFVAGFNFTMPPQGSLGESRPLSWR